MKEKFKENVAGELPKTKSHEPKLPWKLTADDFDGIESPEEEYRSVVAGTSPLKARASFLIMLLVTIFLASFYFIVTAARENRNTRLRALSREKEIISLTRNFDRANSESTFLKENYTQLEKKVADLNAQKELFTGVIESLTKKNEEIATE